MIHRSSFLLLLLSFIFFTCKDEGSQPAKPNLQLQSVNIGPFNLNLTNPTQNINAPFDRPIVATFSAPLEIASVLQAIQLKVKGGNEIAITVSFQDNDKTFVALPATGLTHNQEYELIISNTLKGVNGETFPGIIIGFKTTAGTLTITSLKFSGMESLNIAPLVEISRTPGIEITFSHPINPDQISSSFIRIFSTTTDVSLAFSMSEANTKVTIIPIQPLAHLTRHQLWVSRELQGANQETFSQFIKYFYTQIDLTPKFPVVSDEELLTLVQQQTFKYFYDLAHPASGMARERNVSGNIVTSGGSGFGIMALIVGMERSFITRQQGLERMDKILTFLENADRFHGVWPHWIDGNTRKVIPFSTKDNGGDLVETSFLVQGLITFRQYLNPSDPTENSLINRINTLWEAVEWDWYRRGGQNVLYWHWSPNFNWDMNFALSGYFEQQVTYLLAAASPTHSIPKIVYTNGFAKNGSILRNDTYYGFNLKLGGLFPLFWVHYSYLGLDPHFSDDYASYWDQNVNASLINHAYCVANPKKFIGYSEENWGLTASDNQNGYSAHSPANDLGVISPTAALSSFPYTPVESMKALKFFYYTLGDKLWGPYGFYDAFNITQGWTATSTLAIDQGPIIVMIENHRTGLLWDLFMSAPEVQAGATKLGFVY